MSNSSKMYTFLLLGFLILVGGGNLFPQETFLSNFFQFLGCISLLISVYYFTKKKLIRFYELLKELINKIKGV